MQHAFHFNADRCAQCFACEVACKAAHDLAPHAQEAPGSTGPRYRQVMTVERPANGRKNAKLTGSAPANTAQAAPSCPADPAEAAGAPCPIQYVSMACMHCGQPDCMAVCPAKAIYREPQFGAVLVDRNKCIGCRYCSWACEFGAPQFGADGLMQKCDMCIDRLRAGSQPACVENCCGGAITLQPVDQAEGTMRERAASRMAKAGGGSLF